MTTMMMIPMSEHFGQLTRSTADAVILLHVGYGNNYSIVNDAQSYTRCREDCQSQR